VIHRVKIMRLLPDFSHQLIVSFRMGGDQATAELYGERLRTRWMELNPGHATVLVLDWPSPSELGGHHVMPAAPASYRELAPGSNS
jgi:hypothetical protein